MEKGKENPEKCRGRDNGANEVECKAVGSGEEEDEEPAVVASALDVCMDSCLAPRDNCRRNSMFSPIV